MNEECNRTIKHTQQLTRDYNSKGNCKGNGCIGKDSYLAKAKTNDLRAEDKCGAAANTNSSVVLVARTKAQARQRPTARVKVLPCNDATEHARDVTDAV